MTGRPSGRCAAREALDSLLAWAERFMGCDASLSPEEWYVARDFARIALASPCCADQEQVKEALARAVTYAEEIQRATPPGDARECARLIEHDARAALALLGSQSGKERLSSAEAWGTDEMGVVGEGWGSNEEEER